MITAQHLDITSGIASFSATGPIDPSGGVDVSGIDGYGYDFTLKLQLVGLTVGKKARVQIEGSTDDFVTVHAIWIEEFAGISGKTADIVRTKRRYELPTEARNLIGIAGAKLRANITGLTAGASGSLRAWVEF
jgi:hypothetical protein